MTRRPLSTLAELAVLPAGAVETSESAGPRDDVDECTNADSAADHAGPPGFVAESVPDVPSDLRGTLSVPNSAKESVGAQTC